MRALSLVFKGVDKGATKTVQGIGKSFGALNAAIGTLSFSKLSEMNDKFGKLLGTVAGAGGGAEEGAISWTRFAGGLKAAGEVAGKGGLDLNKLSNVVSGMTLTTTQSREELMKQYKAFRDVSASGADALGMFEKYNKVALASNMESGALATTLVSLRKTWGFQESDLDGVVNNMIATTKQYGMAGNAMDLLSSTTKVLDNSWKELEGTAWSLDKNTLQSFIPQIGEVAGYFRKVTGNMSTEAVSSFAEGIITVRKELKNLTIGTQTDDFLKQLTAGLNLNVDQGGEFVKAIRSGPVETLKLLQSSLENVLATNKDMTLSTWKSNEAYKFLNDTMHISSDALDAVYMGAADAEVSYNALGKGVSNAAGATQQFVKDSNLGIKKFGEQINAYMANVAFDIEKKLAPTLSAQGEAIGMRMAEVGRSIGDAIEKPNTIFKKAMRFGFISKESGLGPAIADIAKQMKLFDKGSKVFDMFMFSIQGIDPMLLLVMVTAISSLAGALPMLAIGIPIIMSLWTALQKAGIGLDDFFDPDKRKNAFEKLFEKLPEAIGSIVEKVMGVVTKVIGIVADYISKNSDKIAKSIESILTSIINALKGSGKLFDALGTLAGDLISVLIPQLTKLFPLAEDIGGHIAIGLGKALEKVPMFGGMFRAISENMEKGKEEAKKFTIPKVGDVPQLNRYSMMGSSSGANYSDFDIGKINKMLKKAYDASYATPSRFLEEKGKRLPEDVKTKYTELAQKRESSVERMRSLEEGGVTVGEFPEYEKLSQEVLNLSDFLTQFRQVWEGDRTPISIQIGFDKDRFLTWYQKMESKGVRIVEGK